MGFKVGQAIRILAWGSDSETVMDLSIGRKTADGQLGMTTKRSEYRVYVVTGWTADVISSDPNFWKQ